MKKTLTQRGFSIINFEDSYRIPCSIQRSSMIGDPHIWVGTEDRMHIDQARAQEIVDILNTFIATGEL